MSIDNAEQQEFWTDQAGPTWIAQMDAMDATLGPVLDGVLARAALKAGECVLDIGCGAGTSTIEAAIAVGSSGSALGADISQTLLAVAMARTSDMPNASFQLADAQTHGFEPASFDCIISRFGVMFFEDTAAAFINMASSLRPGGRMAFATWGAIPENPYFTMPARIAKELFGPLPKLDPDAPGPFALRDISKVTQVLEGAGLVDINADEIKLELAPSGDKDAVAELFCEIGPAGRALDHFEVDAQGRATLIKSLADALEPMQTPNGIRIPALINFFTATKPA